MMHPIVFTHDPISNGGKGASERDIFPIFVYPLAELITIAYASNCPKFAQTRCAWSRHQHETARRPLHLLAKFATSSGEVAGCRTRANCWIWKSCCAFT